MAGAAWPGRAGGRRPVLRHPQRPAAEVPLDQRRCRGGDRHLGAGLGPVRRVRVEFRQLHNKTYGSLAGVIIFLLWLWITNLALLFGAEWDAEIERGRQCRPASRQSGTSSCRCGTPGSWTRPRPRTRRTSNRDANYEQPAANRSKGRGRRAQGGRETAAPPRASSRRMHSCAWPMRISPGATQRWIGRPRISCPEGRRPVVVGKAE